MKKTFDFSILAIIFSVFILSINSCVDQDFDEPPRDGGITDYESNSTIAQVKNLHSGFDIIPIVDDLIIGGVVTADDASGNFYKEMVIEDATGGIVVKLEFTDFNNEYPIGRQLWINCRGLYLDKYFDSYELGGSIDDTGRLIGIQKNLVDNYIVRGLREEYFTPFQADYICELDTDMVNQLVTIKGVEFSSGETDVPFADNVSNPPQSLDRYVKDCSGNTIILRTSGYSNFAGELTPSGNGEVTGILGTFSNTLQLYIRDPRDVASMTDTRCSSTISDPCAVIEPPVEGCDVDENFTGGTQYDPVSEAGWTNVAVVGTETWIYREYQGDVFASMQSYQADSPSNETWLVSPELDLSTQKILNFESELAFWAHDGLSVWVSNDFTGDVTTATWTALDPTLADGSTDNYVRVSSGDVSLPIGGTGHVAFKYEGNSATNTTTYRVDNIFVCEP